MQLIHERWLKCRHDLLLHLFFHFCGFYSVIKLYLLYVLMCFVFVINIYKVKSQILIYKNFLLSKTTCDILTTKNTS